METAAPTAAKKLWWKAAQKGWERSTGRGFAKTCAANETPQLLGSIFLVLACLSFGGTALVYGEDIRASAWPRKNQAPPPAGSSALITVLVLALIVQFFAIVFYYNRYRNCDAMFGFVVYILVTAFTGFIVAMITRPPDPEPSCRSWVTLD